MNPWGGGRQKGKEFREASQKEGRKEKKGGQKPLAKNSRGGFPVPTKEVKKDGECPPLQEEKAAKGTTTS